MGATKEWDLPKVSSKKAHEFAYCPESFEHPAKMDVVLCRKVLKEYTKPGDMVLDPMTGIGTTLVEAALMGRDAIGVELESRFVKATKRNIGLLKKRRTLKRKGKAVVIKGDSRKLSKILREKADVAVFSPPFADKTIQKKFKSESELDRFVDGQRYLLDHGRSKEAIKRFIKKSWRGYSENKKNIGNLKYGKGADAIITSPPFADSRGWKAKDYKKFIEVQRQRCKDGIVKGHYSTPEAELRYIRKAQEGARVSQENIGNLKYGKGVDVIVTSPPFGKEQQGAGILTHKKGCVCNFCKKNQKNAGEFQGYRKVDTVVFSPPFGQAQRGAGIAQRGYDGPKHGPTDLVGKRSYMPENVGESKGQISRLGYGSVDASKKGETYLSAMLQVYAECFEVLKPGGRMVLVLKRFVRKFKVIELDEDTRRLCEAVGFVHEETKLFKLPGRSFWRTLQAKKYGDRVDMSSLGYQYVLVFSKST